MSDEQLEYHVSIHVTMKIIDQGRPITTPVDHHKWPYMAATFPNEADALECAQILKGFLLGM